MEDLPRLDLDKPIQNDRAGPPRKYRETITNGKYRRRLEKYEKLLKVDKLKEDLSKAYDVIDTLHTKEKLRREFCQEHGLDQIEELREKLVNEQLKVNKLTTLWHDAQNETNYE